LILGVVARNGVSHGYAIHQELISWGADKWATVKWGSIYHALRGLEKAGHLEPVGEHEAGRIDYRLTESGRTEFHDMVRDALADAGPHQDRFGAGLAFMPEIPRDEVISALQKRIRALREQASEIEPYLSPGQPTLSSDWHLPTLLDLWHNNAVQAAIWTENLLERIRSGGAG
jgi:DNA-binding PadR family transcriptional regulator